MKQMNITTNFIQYQKHILCYACSKLVISVLEIMEVTLKHPFSMLVAGGRKTGKTEFTKSLLLHANKLISPPLQRIVWCYAKHQPELYESLMEINPAIEYVEGIPSELNEMFDRTKQNLVILDDMMDEGSKDARVSQLFTRGRHDNTSVIFLTQNLFHKNQRNISLNSDYMVVFKNARDKSQIMHLAKQFMPSNIKFLLWAYKDATMLPYSYLLLDLTPNTDDKYRIRAKILPHEAPQFVYIPNKNL